MIGNREKCFSPKGNAIANKNILQKKKKKLNNPEMKMMIGSVCVMDRSSGRTAISFFFTYRRRFFDRVCAVPDSLGTKSSTSTGKYPLRNGAH